MRQNLGTATSRSRDNADKTYVDSVVVSGNVVGQASSVDSEVALFSGTTGKVIKRATGTGLARMVAGVYSVVSRTIDGQAFDGSADITVIAPGTHAATGKTTPVDADEFGIVDSAASNVLKKLLFSDLKATLASWLTTLTATWSNKTLTNPTITNYTESVVAIGTVTTTSTLSLTSGTVQTATLTASTTCTFTMPTAGAGKSFALYVKQPAVTGNGVAVFTGVKWPGATTPTITPAAGRMDIVSFFSDGTSWYGSLTQNYTY